MRTYTWIFVWAILAIWSGGCNKNARHLENKLQGYWELHRVSTITIAGPSDKDFAGGNGDIIRFNGSSYARYANGQLLERGLFRVAELTRAEQKQTCLSPEIRRQFPYRLIFNADDEIGPFRIQGDSLCISSPCISIDASSVRVYKRISVKKP